MSIIAAALKELIAAGMEGDELIAAVARIEAAKEPELTARQKRNKRYYQSRKASEKRLNASYSDVSDASKKNVPPDPPKEKTKNPPSGVKKIECALPDDFEPTENTISKAKSEGWSDPAILYQIGKMRNWAASRGIKRKDWQAQFRNWLSTAIEHKRPNDPDPRTYAPTITAKPKQPGGWPLSWPEETCRQSFLRGDWPPGIGCPEPGRPGCRVPQETQDRWIEERKRMGNQFARAS